MGRYLCRWAPAWLVAATLTAGCTGDNGTAKTPSPIPTAPAQRQAAEETLATQEMDEKGFPKLPEGAGPIDPDAPTEFETTDSGLKYRVLRQGKGRKPKIVNQISVDYLGWLDDGTVFDGSYSTGKRLNHPLARLVKGWQEGIPLIGTGGMIELIVPPELGYRDQPMGKIPPNSTLHFLVELRDVF